ncbi:DUF2244 domain-containing protein [Zavarzinia sp. CC-PAN008]|uniref:DUF2244 domain-containing protein n=1 Tax=Zavarzinia sp. CC-PAN008 TaxID=3243332 RepID=UPI003F7446F6
MFDGRKLWFSARLEPHISLSRQGFTLVVTAFAVVNAVLAVIFILHDAWPVAGFCGLDVVLLWAALRLSYARLRVAETVELYDDALELRRFSRGAQVSAVALQPYWVRVEMARPVEHDTPLHLSSHGRRWTVGAFLTADERAELAEALRDGLARQRAATVAI